MLRERLKRQLSTLIPGFLVEKIIGSLNSIVGFERIPVTSKYEALRGVIRGKNVIVYCSGSVVYEFLKEVKKAITKKRDSF